MPQVKDNQYVQLATILLLVEGQISLHLQFSLALSIGRKPKKKPTNVTPCCVSKVSSGRNEAITTTIKASSNQF